MPRNHGSNEFWAVCTCLSALFVVNSETESLHLVLLTPQRTPPKPMWPAGHKKSQVRLHCELLGFMVLLAHISDPGLLEKIWPVWPHRGKTSWSPHLTSAGPLLGGNLWLWCVTLLQGTCCTVHPFSAINYTDRHCVLGSCESPLATKPYLPATVSRTS